MFSALLSLLLVGCSHTKYAWYMNAYERGFVDGLKEAYRLMETDPEIIYAPGKILDRIKQLEEKPHEPEKIKTVTSVGHGGIQ